MKPTDAPDELRQQVASRLRECGVGPTEPIVVAVSGGSDSTALAVLLAAAGCRSLILAHYDHGIRSLREAQQDLEVVRELAARLDASLEEGRAGQDRLRAEARELGASLEEVAREARYAFLSEVCVRRGSRVVATGHTRDDQVETVLMRLLQGSDLEGLSGMRGCAPLPFGAPGLRAVRPLLAADRATLRLRLERGGLRYSEDPSNADTRYLRNRLRHHVIPVIEEAIPGMKSSVSRTAGRLGELADVVDAAVGRSIRWRPEPAGGEWGLIAERSAFFALPAALRRRALFAAVDRLGVGRRRIPYRFIESVPDSDPGGGGAGGSADRSGDAGRARAASGRPRVLARGHGLRIELDGRWIACRRDIVPNGDRGYLYCVARSLPDGGDAGGVVELELVGPDGQREVVGIAAAQVSPPLIARSRRAGDRIVLPAGRRTLKRLFQDRSIPSRVRDTVPVLEDRDGILGVWCRIAGAPSAWRRGVHADGIEGSRAGARLRVDFSEVFRPYAGQQPGQ